MTGALRALKSGHWNVAKLLFDNGCDVNAQDRCGWNALHWQVYLAHEESVKYLIEKGVDLNAQDTKGGTPLHRTRSVEIAKLLVQHGADVNNKNDEGKCPLDLLPEISSFVQKS